MKTIVQPILALLLAPLLLGGCCGFVKCDCFLSGVYISYTDSTGACTDLYAAGLTLETYAVAGDVPVEGDEFDFRGLADGCHAYLFPDIAHYYVIQSDSLEIHDTLRIQHLEVSNTRQGCCNCGPQIRAIEFEINGQKFNETDVARSY